MHSQDLESPWTMYQTILSQLLDPVNIKFKQDLKFQICHFPYNFILWCFGENPSAHTPVKKKNQYIMDQLITHEINNNSLYWCCFAVKQSLVFLVHFMLHFRNYWLGFDSFATWAIVHKILLKFMIYITISIWVTVRWHI